MKSTFFGEYVLASKFFARQCFQLTSSGVCFCICGIYRIIRGSLAKEKNLVFVFIFNFVIRALPRYLALNLEDDNRKIGQTLDIVVLTEEKSDISRSLVLHNADKNNSRFKMNTKYMFIVAAMAVALVGATAFATDSAFADGKKHYDKNQAISQANACGNGELPFNIFCQNIGSQVQGEENAVAIDGVQQD
jgi:hypothetical protein